MGLESQVSRIVFSVNSNKKFLKQSIASLNVVCADQIDEANAEIELFWKKCFF